MPIGRNGHFFNAGRCDPIGMVMLASHDAKQRATHLLTLRRLEEARTAISVVLTAEPNDGSALRLLAEIELADDNFDLAHDLAVEAVSHLPNPTSFLVLASVERRRGDFAAAVHTCEEGLVIDPDDPALHITLSLAWSGPWLSERSSTITPERQRAAQAATKTADRALELDPDRPNAHYAAAVAALVRHDPLGAANALNPGLELQPDWVEGHLLMSAIRARQGMVKLSSRHLATAGRLNPTNDQPIRQLRQMRGRSFFRRKPNPAPWWLAPEARAVLDADNKLGGR